METVPKQPLHHLNNRKESTKILHHNTTSQIERDLHLNHDQILCLSTERRLKTMRMKKIGIKRANYDYAKVIQKGINNNHILLLLLPNLCTPH